MLEFTAGEDHSEHVMVCLRPAEKTRKAFADMDECDEEMDELHLTLYYLGTTDDAGGEPGKERLYRGLYDFAIHSGYSALKGVPNGFGVFANPDKNVLISLWDIPGIAEFRTHLMDYCKDHGFEPREDNHGFTPHMTLSFSDDPISTLPERPAGAPDEDAKETFDSVWMVWGEEWTQITLP